MAHFFSHLLQAPPDPIFGLTADFLKDPRSEKVNLSIGVYMTEEGNTPVLSCVKKSEKIILDQEVTKEYLPIEGDAKYLTEVAKIVLGESLYEETKGSLSLIQSVGGSGALRLGADLIMHEVQERFCYAPNPTWPNHNGLMTQSGLIMNPYPYYDFQKKAVDYEKMYEFFSSLPPKSILILHVNCHNPSGADLSLEQWSEIADLCLAKELVPFFDGAYLGFVDSFEKDAEPIRLFLEKGVECLVAISFSKNFSLYAERVGFLMVYSQEKAASCILSQLQGLARRTYSNPPLHGAKVISTILQVPDLKAEWEKELEEMKKRINGMRKELVSHLAKANVQTDYSYLLDKNGLFSFCDLSKEQVLRIRNEHAIYMTATGRISIAGLNNRNIASVAKAIAAVGG